MTPKPDIEEIRARCEAAREGPWVERFHRYESERVIVSIKRPHAFDYTICTEAGNPYSFNGDKPTIDFIAHARQDIPDLLNWIEHLKAELEAVVSE